MSITSELRLFAADPYTGWVPTDKQQADLRAIADRIDEKHEAACAEAYGNGVESVALPDMTTYVKLPVDADGEPIHVGDVMNKGEVTCVRDCGKGWEVVLDNLYTYDAPSLHHRAPTVEDVLADVADSAANLTGSYHEGGMNGDEYMDSMRALVAKYAAKLRLAESE